MVEAPFLFSPKVCNTLAMKYMGIDYGTKRIGVALSDEGGSVAFPHSVVMAGADAHTVLAILARTESVSGIVFGLSLTEVGGENPLVESVKKFADILAADTGVPIYFSDERFSSFAAAADIDPKKRLHARKEKESVVTNLDARAAAIILQRFLDKQKIAHRI
jgi:putative holliday junction resolvase